MTAEEEPTACIKCGAPLDLELDVDGHIVLAPECKACLGPTLIEYAELQRQFKFLVDNGLTKVQANRIMCKRIEKRFGK